MRKAQKKEALAFLKNLQEAHEEIRGALHKKKYASAQNMLGECQEFAWSLGEIIEKAEGEGHRTVTCLEEYCKTVFSVYEEIGRAIDDQKKNPINESRIFKALQKAVLQAENSARNDIAVRKEVVFLPYKASMWDSLESLWMEEREKPENDIYVIPIPYYDKNPDGSFRQMHYEGGDYPDYVPVTDWKSYDIAQRRPDVIYIHNPYDQYNYVTSVHPDYYSSKLKQYTDLLIYCPYFVGINHRVAEHFCTVPGVLNADKVLVESDAVKKIYEDAIRSYEQTNNCIGMFGDLQKKLKVAEHGSPKVDRVKRMARETLTVPDDWKRLVFGEDGSKKKVVLYNTTVDAALRYSEGFLPKINRVLSLFKSDTSVVLLWRPHPLLLSTLYAMRPALYKALLELIERYKKEAWGIYDDTADIDRAIVFSDAYYGDWSSVVTMYQAVGKPIMIGRYDI